MIKRFPAAKHTAVDPNTISDTVFENQGRPARRPAEYTMSTKNDLNHRINEKYSSMSKGQKLLAAYITDNYDRAVFLTAEKLGEAVGVSESTVVRFAMFLGYKGYPEFQEALEEQVKNRLNSVQRMEVAYGRVKKSDILDTVLRADEEKIRRTREKIDPAAFELAQEILLQADQVYVIGIRSCEPLASFLSFYLNLVRPGIHQIRSSNTSEIFEQMIRINEKDAIMGISFPRYSMRTLKALEFANSRNAKVITLTDCAHSPMNLYSSCNLLAESDMSSAADSLVAPLSVINALILALCMQRQDEVAKNLDDLEAVWDDYQFYGNDEIDPVDDELKMHFPETEKLGGGEKRS